MTYLQIGDLVYHTNISVYNGKISIKKNRNNNNKELI